LAQQLVQHLMQQVTLQSQTSGKQVELAQQLVQQAT
jgi:hypothetical protein